MLCISISGETPNFECHRAWDQSGSAGRKKRKKPFALLAPLASSTKPKSWKGRREASKFALCKGTGESLFPLVGEAPEACLFDIDTFTTMTT